LECLSREGMEREQKTIKNEALERRLKRRKEKEKKNV